MIADLNGTNSFTIALSKQCKRAKLKLRKKTALKSRLGLSNLRLRLGYLRICAKQV